MTEEISTDLVVIFEPGKMTKDNSQRYEENWRKQMKNADIIPQSEDDVKFLRKHQKECLELEGLIEWIFEKAKRGNANIKETCERLDAIKLDTKAHRLRIGRSADNWLDNQKRTIVQERVEKVAAESRVLFTGKITKAGKAFCEIVPRLEEAGKKRRTLDTYSEAVSAEYDVVISEMRAVAVTCTANLAAINATELPALFQDSESLMMLPEDQLAAEIGRRVAEYNLQEEKKKAQVKRNPEKLVELKEKVNAIENVVHLENWWKAHEGEVKEVLPHSEDIEELLTHCGGRKAELNIKLRESRNAPPPVYEDNHPKSGPAHAKPTTARQEKPAAKEELPAGQQDATQGSRQEDDKELAAPREDLSFTFKVTIPGRSQESKDKANALATDIWQMVSSRGCVAEEIKD